MHIFYMQLDFWPADVQIFNFHSNSAILGTWALNKVYGHWYHLRSQFDNVGGQRITWDDWHGHSKLAL